MSISEMIYEMAIADIGTAEWPGAKNNPVVMKYYKDAGHPEVKNDEVFWCAAFVGSVLAKCGLPNTGSLLARSYESYGEPVELGAARRGDIVILSRGNVAWQGHVGFFHGFGAGKVELIGGNQSDKVSIQSYDADRIVAIRRASAPRSSLAESKSLTVSQLVKVGQVASPGVAYVAGVPWETIAVLGGIALIGFGLMIYMDKERVASWFSRGNR